VTPDIEGDAVERDDGLAVILAERLFEVGEVNDGLRGQGRDPGK
jgi:hypothetical protein